MTRKFCTILHSLKSPKNVGMILRSHVANGGSAFITTGHDLPWAFKKGTRAFSRKLERKCRILHIPDPLETLNWCKAHNYSTVAIEISETPTFLDEFSFPGRTAIIVGNEGEGIDTEFLKKCDHVATIKQFGEVGSLNVAVSASIAMYEFNRSQATLSKITGSRYNVS